MKRKLLKQIKFQWRSNLWLVVELVIISVVLWYIIDLLAVMTQPMLEPNGFSIDHCYSLTLRRSGELKPGETEMTSGQENLEILKRLRRYPGVEGVAVSNAVEPYCGNFMGVNMMDVDNDSLMYGSNSPSLRYGKANPDFLRVFRIEGVRGETPEQLAELFGKGGRNILAAENFTQSVDSGAQVYNPIDLVGHRFKRGKKEYKLVAVLKNVKREDNTPLKYNSLLLEYLDDNSEDEVDWIGSLSIRVRPEADKDFVARFREDMARQFHVGLSYIADIKSFDLIRDDRLSEESKMKSKLYIVVGFLLLNVFLGLLGTFWYRTRQRVSEMAVRMTFGASRGSIFRRLMSEGVILLVIATVIAVGIDCAMAYLELNMRPEGDHLTFKMIALASGITFLLALTMIFLGVYFPARAAMKVEPAVALHDE